MVAVAPNKVMGRPKKQPTDTIRLSAETTRMLRVLATNQKKSVADLFDERYRRHVQRDYDRYIAGEAGRASPD